MICAPSPQGPPLIGVKKPSVRPKISYCCLRRRNQVDGELPEHEISEEVGRLDIWHLGQGAVN